VFGAFGWQYGRVLNFDAGGLTASEEYISRLMPLTTMLGIRFQPVEARWHVETLVLRAEDADKLSAGDQRDTQRIPPGGTPSYTLWNLNVGWAISDQATLDAGVDNITDVDYRVHGSGSNGVGRNFVLGVSVRF
jgi:hemoglobin/transferrin/lactoferrin receptor protein